MVRFLNERAGGTIPSPAILGKIGRSYVEGINRFAKANEIQVVRFTKDVVKEDVARPHMQQAEREDPTGVVMLGVAQEKAWAWRSWRDGGHDAHPHFEFGRQAVFVNHHYRYILDPEWGPSFVKTNAYAPYPVWIYLNGHEWAKRQAARQGIEFTPLDNGFRACEEPERLATICDSLSEQDILAFCDRWMRTLPSPFTRLSAAATGTATRCGRSRCPTPACSTSPPRAARGLSRRSAINSTSDAPTAVQDIFVASGCGVGGGPITAATVPPAASAHIVPTRAAVCVEQQ